MPSLKHTDLENAKKKGTKRCRVYRALGASTVRKINYAQDTEKVSKNMYIYIEKGSGGCVHSFVFNVIYLGTQNVGVLCVRFFFVTSIASAPDCGRLGAEAIRMRGTLCGIVIEANIGFPRVWE